MPAVQIECPNCSSYKTYVVLTRVVSDGRIIRRRKCNGCGHRWYTIQPPEQTITKYEANDSV